MNRREHSHRIACAMQVTFSRNVNRQSLVRTSHPWRDTGFSRTLPPTFLFLHIQLSKIRLRKRDVVGCVAFGSSPAECRSRGSLGFHKGELFSRQRRAAL